MDIYLFVHERLGSLWQTCRLADYSTQYNYRVYDMRFQTNARQFVDVVLPARPGRKALVYNACCSHVYALTHWPKDAVMLLASDETARWGFSHKQKLVWGPHGRNGPLATDSNGNMVLPAVINPWFKQYYSSKYRDVYGDTVDFLPLGSRSEFQDPSSTMIAAPARHYIYSFMGAGTNPQRHYMQEVMQADTLIPPELVRS